MLFVWSTSVERSLRQSKDLAYYVSLVTSLTFRNIESQKISRVEY